MIELKPCHQPDLNSIADLGEFSPYLVKKSPTHLLYHFNNDYGASIINHPFSYGTELAVIFWSQGTYEIVYDTAITSNVIGHIEDLKEITELLSDIKVLV
ncbi:hypothetical protein [Hutsoniella sourekii]|uniref:hypothetical protein n=1 Tax=Hutsoniella sourekii TaxID=87650 RepID=UPI0004B63170|nr:hypothetical protein [Hutsoniella sourekii]